MDIITDEIKLSERADEVDVRKDNKLVREITVALKDTIREHNLTSLSANQIGYNKRIFVINFNGDLRTFINPVISSVKGIELSRETCPSVPDKTYIRIRHNDITAMYQTPLGKIESNRFLGMAAKIFQHEVDHLDGLLISDIGLEIDDDFDNATEDERQQVINMYLDSLDIKQKEIDKEIEEDQDLKQLSDGIKFMEKVQKGEIELEHIKMTDEQIDKYEKEKKEFLDELKKSKESESKDV